ncbi:hypothetical protein QYE76_047495 [Lolium multiflorum]|uniref:Anthranilate N-benzoyltransferase protein 1 n=1 Tax=Lolium multiflorum TaxID=4521 RepID=A0AAD8TRV2_LOLMU|nr:hypothetical protein QYE76_047495 [Lolium multiflorum]
MIYLFRPLGVGCPADFFSADILRTAMARALVPFYPLAGRLGMALDGRLEIDCSGQGAVFVVAQSDAVLEDLEGFAPSKAMCDMFVPPYEEVVGAGGRPLLLLQVTFLHGGGVVLGTGMHHYALDGRSSFHFMQTWSSLARGAAGDAVPLYLDRSPLHARSPPVILFDHSHEYCRNAAGSATGAASPSELAGAILRVTSAQ